jgi:hypothetical protein
MSDKEEIKEPTPAVNRLCSEIQLFDLCELDSCSFRCSRYCTNDELLARFESIKEEDDRNNLLYEDDETDEDIDPDQDFDDYDDSFEGDDE